MKKWLILFCICTACLHATPFYQNPSPEAVYEWLELNKSKQAPEEDWPFVPLAAIFIAQVLKVHPSYAETFSRDFLHFSSVEQSIFLHAFSIAGIQDSRISDTQISQTLSLSELNHLEFKSINHLQSMAISFIATGDEFFLVQLMAFLNSDPETLFLVYRHFEKFLAAEAEFLKILASWPKRMRVEFVLKAFAFHCLNFIMKEDPMAEEKISQLRETDPKLDYLGTLVKIIIEDLR